MNIKLLVQSQFDDFDILKMYLLKLLSLIFST